MGKQQERRNLPVSLAENAFPVVGIGASAGGLDAIRRLLENLPENTGAAFVIVQHLATGQESMLPEILSRFTKMHVQKVDSGMRIESNQVYVIPPGKIMTIEDGNLKLQPKGASLKLIDEFFCSLAHEQKKRAIGIVLSGTGTDGTHGLQTIKAEDGITFAQDPKTAQYPDMPKNAIAAETVYFVLNPENIAEELVRITKHPELAPKQIEENEPAEVENETDLQTIFTLLKASFGINFENYKKSTINRRVTRRIILNKFESIKDYVTYLRMHYDELEALFQDLLINVTRFFREPETFALLKEKVFPKLIETKVSDEPIRVWIPGCSTGEEAYSTAISIEEFLKENNIFDVQIQVFGTDVNDKNVEKARKGLYSKNIEDYVSENQIKRFFASVNGNYQIIKQIRDMCIFAKHDLTKDPPFSNLDLIVCRNLLIYFESNLQERIIPIFHYGLKSSGYLVLGESESVGKFTYLFGPLTKKGVIFQKKITQPNFNMHLEPSTPYSRGQLVKKSTNTDFMSLLEKQVDQLLMAEYLIASLVLSSNLDVLAFRGKVDPYISIDAGAASLNATKIVRKELRPALQTGVYRAKKGQIDIKETVRLGQGKTTKTINIQIKPIKLPMHEDSFFLAIFDETAKTLPSSTKTGTIPVQSQEESLKDKQVKELSEDLESTKQLLQTVIEQKEATNEELRSSMEELQSSNEELMSTNEELETAKEELQSTNEELETLNDELKNRNQSLSVLNDDLANLMGTVDTAVVIVDNNFMIRRFNSSAEELLRLMPSDVDKLITGLRLGLPIEVFGKKLIKAQKLEPVREEIHSDNGRWYQMRIRPYLTQEKQVVGLVISFADVTEIKILEDKLKVISSFTRHDVRNKLMTINGNIFLAKKLTRDQQEVEKYLNQIPETLAKIERIFDISKAYEMLGKQDLEFIDVGKTVEDAASQFFNDLKDIKIINEVKGFKVLADPMLTTVFGNLIENTLKYGEKTTQIRVYTDKQVGDSIKLIYEDNGVGISVEDKKRLFEKGFGKGTGYGLFLIKRACEIYGWTISEEGEPGKGVRLVIKIPKKLLIP
jgi:two-component system, chemotaxis family, CheB/CheR fusion protein